MAAERPSLVLMTADTVGGVWHYAVELAAALGKEGVRVALATMGAPLTDLQREQAERVSTVSVLESAYRLEWMPEPWRDLARAGAWLLDLERQLRPDVVHLNQFAFGALDFHAPKLLVAHSCVLSWWKGVHGTPAPQEWDRYHAVVRDGLSGAALVAAPTAAMLSTLQENYDYEGPGVVIPNGRSADGYAPVRKEPIILSAGRLWDAAKNLTALEAVAPDLPWPILVAGPSSPPGGGSRVPQGVRMLGELAPAALAREMSRAAIYALPARYEPFGLSALEAALAGCALVLGDVPSLREVWGETAAYVAPDDHAALRECLMRLIANPASRKDLARAARARALEYTPERTAQAYLSAYCTVAQARRADAVRRVTASRLEARACTS